MDVLMIGVDRKARGGISTVVEQYHAAGLEKKVNLRYIATVKDGSKIKKMAVAAAAFLRFLVCLEQCDIVHVHMASRASFYRKSLFIRAAYKAGKKVIIHMHGAEFDLFYEEECDDRQKEKVQEIFSMADLVIALSEDWKDRLSKICEKEKIRVLHNAVKMPGIRQERYDKKDILFLGRIGQRKGVFDLLSAVPKIVEQDSGIHFYLGGDGDIDLAKRLCAEKQITEHVTFLGWVTGEEKERYLKKCSVFVLPSYHEGMPMAILEAMSYGNVVVSTYTGGILDIIKDGENGYLVQAGDVDGIARAILSATNGERKEEIGKNAYDTVLQRSDIEKNIGYLVDLYKSLLDKAHR